MNCAALTSRMDKIIMDRRPWIEIAAENCTGCGRCVRICPYDTLALKADKAVVAGAASLHCDHCAAVCPTQAICVKTVDRRLSEFKSFQTPSRWLPHGEADLSQLVHVMRSRRSCRNFKDKPVPGHLLEDLMKIGVTAPSGSNCQPWAFTVLDTRGSVLALGERVAVFFEHLNRLAGRKWLRRVLALLGRAALQTYSERHFKTVAQALQQFRQSGRDLLFHGAPAVIVVSARADASCPAEDALLATQNMLLAAHAMGLGTCLVGFAVEALRRDKNTAAWLQIADNEQPYAVIALGFPDERYERVAGRLPFAVRYIRAL